MRNKIKSENIYIKNKINLYKTILLIFGYFFYININNSIKIKNFCDYLHSLKLLKIFTLLKVIEFIIILLNRITKDLDIQILTIINEKKNKHKFFSFIILIIIIHFYVLFFYLYIFSVKSILNDPEKSLIPLLFKLNYIELKKCVKPLKKKNFFNQICIDIFDRFFNCFVLIFIFVSDYSNNKYNNFYLNRFLFVLLFEILFDYLKDLIVFRVSLFNPKILKLMCKELIIYYEMLIKKENEIEKNFENKTLILIGKQYKYHKYINYIDDIGIIITMTVQNNIIIYSIFTFVLIFDVFNLFMLKIYLILVLIVIKILNEKFIKYLINKKNNIKNNNKKIDFNEIELYVNAKEENKIEKKIKK